MWLFQMLKGGLLNDTFSFLKIVKYSKICWIQSTHSNFAIDIFSGSKEWKASSYSSNSHEWEQTLMWSWCCYHCGRTHQNYKWKTQLNWFCWILNICVTSRKSKYCKQMETIFILSCFGDINLFFKVDYTFRCRASSSEYLK